MTVKEYLSYFEAGTYALCELEDNEFRQKHYDISDLFAFEKMIGKNDVFMSLNPFKFASGRLRCSENVEKLNMLYCDLDLHHGNLSKEAALFILENDYFEQSIPTPSFIIDSGRGLWLQWLLEGEDGSKADLWKNISLQLCRTLVNFGADSRCAEPARICRIPGTINSKSKTAVAVIGGSCYKYTLSDFIEGYGFKSIAKPTGKAYSAAGKSAFSAVNRNCLTAGCGRYILMNKRLLDLYRICDYFQWDLGDKVRKEITLFLARYWAGELGYDDEEALSFALNFNARFVNPLSEEYVRVRTESARRATHSKGKIMYNYKNETLVELLGISGIEKELQLQSIKSKEESKRRKKEANRAYYNSRRGKHSKKEKVKIRRQNVAVLVARGYTVKHICSRLDISRATCYADIEAVRVLIEVLKNKKNACPKNSSAKLYNTISSFTLLASVVIADDIPMQTTITMLSPPFLLWLREDRKKKKRAAA